MKNYHKPRGFFQSKYHSQLKSSLKRGHPAPDYTFDKLIEWLEKQPNLTELWTNWVKSEYERKLAPSMDRVDITKPYTFDNLELVTWQENYDRATRDKSKGLTKNTKDVGCFDDDHNLIMSFISTAQAARHYNVSGEAITRALTKGTKSCQMFWKYL